MRSPLPVAKGAVESLPDPQGPAVRVVGEPSGLARHVVQVLRHCGLACVGSRAKAETLEVRVAGGRETVRAPAGATAVVSHLGIEVRRRGDRLYVDDGSSRLELDPGGHRVVAGLDPALAQTATCSRRNLILLYGVLTMLRFRGLFALHAAAVARDGVGCLLVAPSGSGKSTAALGLVRQGWSFVSDDSVLLTARGESVFAYPLRRDLFFKGGGAETAGERWTSLEVGGRQVRRLVVAEAYPDRVAAVCVPRLLLFPVVRDAARSELVSIESPEALRQLLEQSTIVDLEPSMARPHAELLRNLVVQCGAWRLEAGRDLLDKPWRLATMLEARLGSA